MSHTREQNEHEPDEKSGELSDQVTVPDGVTRPD
jgi:hypothetical protein